jgi:aryl-alcohol dehydrogenase-like predicted oxidoreductase
MQLRPLGQSGLHVPPICLGTMTFGEQVGEAHAHRILDRSLERGVNFLDTAEMYPVPPSAATFSATETIIGRWLAQRPGVRDQVLIATKVAGPSRGMPWIREGSQRLNADDIEAACNASLRRLQTDVIDLYQIHWPVRHVPAFGIRYYDPAQDPPDATPIREQLEGLARLVRAGKVRAVGLSNETPYGVHEFVRLAEQHGLPRVASVQNPYALVHRTVDNGLDESLHRLNVGLLAYSPLAFGLLTGKYDETGFDGPGAPGEARLVKFERFRQQRWARPAALAAARCYSALARAHGLTPTQMALAFCYQSWRVTSTIIGVTSVAQLDECLDAWGTVLSPELLVAIDEVRADIQDPAI